MKNYKLKRPIEFEGKKIDNFNFDFEKMTKKNYNRCVKEAKIRNKKGMAIQIPIFCETFRLVFAGMAANVATEAMFNLYPKDILEVSKLVSNFFFGEEEETLDALDEEEEDFTNDIYKLKDEIIYNGATITELKFDFDGVTPKEYRQCETDARRIDNKRLILATPSENETFKLCFAAKACGLDSEALQNLSLRDNFAVCLRVDNFLLVEDSDESEETEETIPQKTSNTKTKQAENQTE